MNKAFKLVWNRTLNLWQCASENTKSQGKSKASKDTNCQQLTIQPQYFLTHKLHTPLKALATTLLIALGSSAYACTINEVQTTGHVCAAETDSGRAGFEYNAQNDLTIKANVSGAATFSKNPPPAGTGVKISSTYPESNTPTVTITGKIYGGKDHVGRSGNFEDGIGLEATNAKIVVESEEGSRDVASITGSVAIKARNSDINIKRAFLKATSPEKTIIDATNSRISLFQSNQQDDDAERSLIRLSNASELNIDESINKTTVLFTTGDNTLHSWMDSLADDNTGLVTADSKEHTTNTLVTHHRVFNLNDIGSYESDKRFRAFNKLVIDNPASDDEYPVETSLSGELDSELTGIQSVTIKANNAQVRGDFTIKNSTVHIQTKLSSFYNFSLQPTFDKSTVFVNGGATLQLDSLSFPKNSIINVSKAGLLEVSHPSTAEPRDRDNQINLADGSTLAISHLLNVDEAFWWKDIHTTGDVTLIGKSLISHKDKDAFSKFTTLILKEGAYLRDQFSDKNTFPQTIIVNNGELSMEGVRFREGQTIRLEPEENTNQPLTLYTPSPSATFHSSTNLDKGVLIGDKQSFRMAGDSTLITSIESDTELQDKILNKISLSDEGVNLQTDEPFKDNSGAVGQFAKWNVFGDSFDGGSSSIALPSEELNIAESATLTVSLGEDTKTPRTNLVVNRGIINLNVAEDAPEITLNNVQNHGTITMTVDNGTVGADINNLSGTGDLVKKGSGALVVHEYSNDFIDEEGNERYPTFEVQDGRLRWKADLVDLKELRVAKDAIFDINTNERSLIISPITGEGDVLKTGSGLSYIAMPQTYTGKTIVAEGDLRLGIDDDALQFLKDEQEEKSDDPKDMEQALATLDKIEKATAQLAGDIEIEENATLSLSHRGRLVLNDNTNVVNNGTLDLQAGARFSVESDKTLGGTIIVDANSQIDIDPSVTLTLAEGTILETNAASYQDKPLVALAKVKGADQAILKTSNNIDAGNFASAFSTWWVNGSPTINSESTATALAQETIIGEKATLLFTGSSDDTHTVTNDGILVLNAEASDTPNTFASIISGDGQLIKEGDGKLIITGIHDYTGKTSINKGELQVGDGTIASQIGNGNLLINENAILRIVDNATLALDETSKFSNLGTLIFEKGSAIEMSDDQFNTISAIGKVEGKENIKVTSSVIVDPKEMQNVKEWEIGTTENNPQSLDGLENYGDTLQTVTIKEGANANLSEGNTLTVDKDKELTVDGNLAMDGQLDVKGTVNVDGTVAIGNNGSVTTVDDSTFSMREESTLDLDGSLTIGGTLDIAQGSTIHKTDNGSISLKDGSVVSTNANEVTDNSALQTVVSTAEGKDQATLETTAPIKAGNVAGEFKNWNVKGEGDNSATDLAQGTTTIDKGTNLTANVDTIKDTQTVVNEGTLTVGSEGKNTTIDGHISGSGNVVVGSNNQNTTLNGDISGSGHLVKEGSGNLTITSENPNFTGSTDVKAGNVNVTDVSLQGDVNLASGTSLNLTQTENSTTNQTVGNVNVADNAKLNVNNAENTNTTVGNVSGAGNIVKEGSGDLTITSDNKDFTGSTTINEGNLNLNNGSLQGNIAVNEGANLNITHTADQSSEQTVGNVTVNSGATTHVDNTQNTNINSVSGDGNLVKDGTGTLAVTGEKVDTATTQVNEGTLQVGNGTQATTFNMQNFVMAANAILNIASNAILELGSKTLINNSGTLNLADNAVLSVTDEKFNSLSNIQNAFGADKISGLENTVLNSSVVMNAVEQIKAVKAWNISTNSNTEAQSLDGLGGNFGTNLSAISINQAASAVLSNTLTVGANKQLSISGLLKLEQSAELRVEGSLALNAGSTLENNSKLVIANSSSSQDVVSISGNISGEGDVIKQGDGTMTVAKSQAYTGKTSVEAGTFKLLKEVSLASSSLVVKNGANFYASLDTVTENSTARRRLRRAPSYYSQTVSDIKVENGGQLTVDVMSADNYSRILSIGDITLEDGSKLFVNFNGNFADDVPTLNEVLTSQDGTINGMFSKVEDNSYLFDFEPLLSEDNKVLKLAAKLVDQTPTDSGTDTNPTDNGNDTTNTPSDNSESTGAGNSTSNNTGSTASENTASSGNTGNTGSSQAPSGPVSKLMVATGHTSLLSLATALDRTLQQADAPLAKAFQPLSNAQQVTQAVIESQPLLGGTGNRVILEASDLMLQQAQTNRCVAGEMSGAASGGSGAWVNVLGNWSTQKADAGVSGYKAHHGGIALGLGTCLNPKLKLGVMAGYIQSKAESKGVATAHTMKANSWQLGVYGNAALSEKMDVDFLVAAGRANIDGTRHLGLWGLKAESDTHANILRAGMGMNWRLGSETTNVTPYARLDYAHITTAAYTESGAKALNLHVAKQRSESLIAGVGVKFKHQLSDQFALQAKVGVGYDLMNKGQGVNASFVGTPNSQFKVRNEKLGRTMAEVGLGISAKLSKNTSLGASAQAYFGKGRTNTSAQLNFQMKF